MIFHKIELKILNSPKQKFPAQILSNVEELFVHNLFQKIQLIVLIFPPGVRIFFPLILEREEEPGLWGGGQEEREKHPYE